MHGSTGLRNSMRIGRTGPPVHTTIFPSKFPRLTPCARPANSQSDVACGGGRPPTSSPLIAGRTCTCASPRTRRPIGRQADRPNQRSDRSRFPRPYHTHVKPASCRVRAGYLRGGGHVVVVADTYEELTGACRTGRRT